MGIKDIQSQFELLSILGNAKYRRAVLAKADKKLVNVICEVVYNVLKRNISIPEHVRTRLFKHKKLLRKLCEKSKFCSKKKILVQHGGFLQFLIPAVIGGLAQIISSYVSRPDPPAQQQND